MMSATKPLTIGTVCRALRDEFDDVSISKIRFLEDQGLLTPRRTPGGYRQYGVEEVDRLRTILRLQRDEFLPLRVIREELATGITTPDRPARRRATAVADGARRYTREEILAETAADPDIVRELQEFGLIVPATVDRLFGETDVEIVRLAMQLGPYGLGPRHLRQFHAAVTRAAGMLEGVVSPALRSRNADRREAGLDDLAALARISADLAERFLVREVLGAAGG
jgi:DNA-binding transcriptional MerR regulator